MAEAVPEKRWGKPKGGRSTLFLLAFVALLAVVAWLLSERNARQYALVFDDGVVSVKKGLLFPVGRQTFKTADPQLAQAYAPFHPPPGVKLDDERVFDDRAGLDQGLFELLARWARDDIATEKPEQLERGLGWIVRAEKLQQISAAQRTELLALRAESGFFEARALVDRAAEDLRQARERLKLTAGSASPHAGDAVHAVAQLDPLVESAYRVAQALATPGSRQAPAGGEAADATGAQPVPAQLPSAAPAAQPGSPAPDAPGADPSTPAAATPTAVGKAPSP